MDPPARAQGQAQRRAAGRGGGRLSGALATTIAAYALCLGAWAAVSGAVGRGPRREQGAAAVVLETAAVGQALAAGAALALGHRAADRATIVGYLIASVVILPVVAGRAVRGRTRADALALALACLAVGVVALRLRGLWSEPA